jgi:hypothetical protein
VRAAVSAIDERAAEAGFVKAAVGSRRTRSGLTLVPRLVIEPTDNDPHQAPSPNAYSGAPWDADYCEAIGERTRDALRNKRGNGERVGNIEYGYGPASR